MRSLLVLLPVLGCAGMMIVCMLLMGGYRPFRRRDQSSHTAPNHPSNSADEVAELRAEVAELRAQLDARDATTRPGRG